MSGTFTPVVRAYRFYEDGTESGSAAIAAQDTDILRDVSANSKVHLRYSINETGAKSGATTDDYQLQYSKNGGAYANVTASSSNVQADTGSSLTDDGATTDRATGISNPASGTFVAGIQEEGDGQIANHQLTASNFTEHVWALLLIAADLKGSDTLDFRVTLNGGTPGMTNNVTPTVTVKAVVIPPVATLTITPFVPSVLIPQTITPPVIALTTTTFAPSVTAGVLVTPPVLALTTTRFAPQVNLKVIPGVTALTTTLFVPVVGLKVIPSTASLTTTLFAPTLKLSVVPPVLALTTTGFAPLVTASSGESVVPGTLAFTLTAFVPTVTAGSGGGEQPRPSGGGGGGLRGFLGIRIRGLLPSIIPPALRPRRPEVKPVVPAATAHDTAAVTVTLQLSLRLRASVVRGGASSASEPQQTLSYADGTVRHGGTAQDRSGRSVEAAVVQMVVDRWGTEVIRFEDEEVEELTLLGVL